MIDTYIDCGVQGLVLGAGTGQHPYLSADECCRLYEIGAKRVDGRCHLICQTSALVVDEVIERSKHAQGLGADALMILPPYLEGPEDDDGLFEFYRQVDREVEIGVIGYCLASTVMLVQAGEGLWAVPLVFWAACLGMVVQLQLMTPRHA